MYYTSTSSVIMYPSVFSERSHYLDRTRYSTAVSYTRYIICDIAEGEKERERERETICVKFGKLDHFWLFRDTLRNVHCVLIILVYFRVFCRSEELAKANVCV